MIEPGAAPRIRRLLAEQGALSFRDFMQAALYDPGCGYYMRAGIRTGAGGDFSTSSDVSPAFGRRLAVQAIEVWERLGRGSWTAVELGPGRGLLATDFLDGLREHSADAFGALQELVLAELSPSLAEQQRARLDGAFPGFPARWVAGLDEIGAGAVRGVILANELLDALPVHLMVRRGDRLLERFVVAAADGALAWDDRAPSDPRLADLAARYGLCAEDGWQAEICPGLEPLAAEVARALDAGLALFIDYGHPAARLADADHADGTLLAYHRHRVERDLLARPGLQDLTAHVNWDHAQDAFAAAGLTVAGRVRQDRFLLALGLLDDLSRAADAGGQESPGQLARRLAARALVLPDGGGGRRFEALLLVKGIAPDLRGLADPFRGLADPFRGL